MSDRERISLSTGSEFASGAVPFSAIPRCVELVSETFKLAPGVVADWFEKRISRNPWQEGFEGVGVGLWLGGELVAVRGMFGQPWWLDGRPVTIGFAAHTALKSDLRGGGLGGELIRKSREWAAMMGSTSSGVATQKIHAKSGHVAVGSDNDFYRARVSFRGALQKHLGGSIGSWVGGVTERLTGARVRGDRRGFSFAVLDRCDDRFDTLWEQARSGYRSCLVRSAEYLNWRIFDQPTCPLRLAGLFDEEGGALRAYAVWHVQAFDEHIRQAALRDLFSAKEDDASRRVLLAHLFELWRVQGISWASLEVAHATVTPLFQTLGFEHVPSVGSRYHIHSTSELPSEVWEDWYRSGLDGDYFDLAGPEFL